MAYSIDLRQRVVDFIEAGGGITKATHLFQVSRSTIYRWLERDSLEPTKVARKPRKLDWQALAQDVKDNPGARLIDRAQKFEVGITTIYYALRQMNITRKKNSFDIEKEIEQRELRTSSY